MRKTLAFIISLTLIFSLFPLQSHAESQEVILLEKQKEIVEDGEVVGTLYRTITRKITGNKILLNTKEIKKYDNGEVLEDSEVTTIEVINENEAKINGEKYDLNEVIYSEPNSEAIPTNQMLSNKALESGGLYTYIKYEDKFIPQLVPDSYVTTMTTASGIKNRLSIAGNAFLDPHGAKDDAITRTQPTNGANKLAIINFKHYAGDVSAARNTINMNVPLLMVALGVTVLSTASVIGAIGGAVSVAGFAVAIWDAGSDADSSMGSAYAILKSF